MLVVDMDETGKRIKELTKRSGLDAKGLAYAVGLAKSQAVYKWFNGVSMPSLDNLVILADLFGVGMDDIVVTMDIPVH